MKKGVRIGLGGVLILVLLVGNVFAAFPRPVGFVNDYINVIDPESKNEMEALARKVREEQGIEIAVVTLDSTEGMSIEEYAVELFNDWGIGSSTEDSGLLMLLILGEEQREIRVEVGYQLEGILPDGKVGAILDQYVLPYFYEGQWGQGLLTGMKAYVAELSGEEFELAEERDNDFVKTVVSFFILMMLLMIFGSRTPFIMGPGRRSSRGYVPPTRGPRGGGGFGGFGGFGGGRSGGGGASRRF
ncbi:MAG TPA: TPM domain-containing protein [Firmicutes bacterium]|nr:TPM domain-containing protein [Bacillota bacterium]